MVIDMKYEAQMLDRTDNSGDSKTSGSLAANNQEHEINTPDAIKQANASATAKLESSGELPPLSLGDMSNPQSGSIENPTKGTSDAAIGKTDVARAKAILNPVTERSTSDAAPVAKALPDAATGKAMPDSATGKAMPDSATGKAMPDSATGKATPDSATAKATSDSATAKATSETAAAKANDNQATAAKTALTAEDLQHLNSAIEALKGAAQTLSQSPHNSQDLAKVNADEKTLHTDEMNYMHASAKSTSFADYDKSMSADHSELKDIANGLLKDGQKADASQTTAYYPTSHYEKYFNKVTGVNPTNPTDPTGPLKDQTSYTNMQNDTWNKNLNAGEIGGKGIDPNMQLSDADGKLTATMTGGAYTDGLVSNTQKLNPNDNTVQLNYDVNIKPGSDLHALETDAAITTGTQANGKTLTAMAASQFVMNPKTGTMEFDTSGTNHQWVDAVNNIPMPKDGTNMDVSMTVKMVGDKYEYTGLTVDGKSYAINPSVGDFTMTTIGPKGWTPDTIHTQLQQDLGADGGWSTVTYNDVQVNQGNS
jgi:hypothetical protein